MSSYIAFELDALNVVPDVAAAAQMPAGDVAHGLLKLWAWCFREKTDRVSPTHLAGFFGGKPAGAALEAFGFLVSEGVNWRVKGAERYLRVAEGRRKGGVAAAGNLIPGGPKKAQRQPRGEPRGEPSPSREAAEAEPRLELGLSPSTEHRTPNTELKEQQQPLQNIPIAAFEIKEPDIELIDTWGKEDFWRAAEVTRRSMGYPPQKWPTPLALSRWWSESRGIAEVRDLAQAFTRFAADKHWKTATPPAPFGGFMTQWSNFLPLKGP